MQELNVGRSKVHEIGNVVLEIQEKPIGRGMCTFGESRIKNRDLAIEENVFLACWVCEKDNLALNTSACRVNARRQRDAGICGLLISRNLCSSQITLGM